MKQLFDRFKMTRILQQLNTQTAIDNIDVRLELCKQGLAAVSQKSNARRWAFFQNEMGLTLIRAYQLDRDISKLERAIEHLNLAIAALEATQFILEYSSSRSNKGLAQFHLAKTLPYDELVILEESVLDEYRKTVDILRDHHLPMTEFSPDNYVQYPKITALTNLAITYQRRKGGELIENQRLAFQYSYEALEYYFSFVKRFGIEFVKKHNITITDSEIIALNNLCLLYLEDIVGNRHENLEKVISHGETAIKLAEHAVRLGGDLEEKPAQNFLRLTVASLMNTIGAAYVWRSHGNKQNNVRTGIRYLETAYALRRELHAVYEQAESLNNLMVALTYLSRWEVVNFGTVIEEVKIMSIYVKKRGFADLHVVMLHNLGIAYHRDVTGEPFQAINYLEQAREEAARIGFDTLVLAASIELGSVYTTIGKEEEAINTYRTALEAGKGKTLSHIFQWGQEKLAELYFGQNNWSAAYEYYRDYINISQNTISSGIVTQSHLAERSNVHLACLNASYALLKIGNYEEALITLEENKATLLREALYLHSISRKNEKVTPLHIKLRALEAEYDLPYDDPRRRNSVTIIEEIRVAKKEISQFFSNPRIDLTTVLKKIPPNTALAIPFFSSAGGAIIIITRSTTNLTASNIVYLDDLNRERFHELLYGVESKLGWMRNYVFAQAGLKLEVYSNWLEAIDDLTKRIWDSFIGEIHMKIHDFEDEIENLIIVPQGGLQNLPLHASWHLLDGQKKYLSDYYCVTYLPSLTTLINLNSSEPKSLFDNALVLGVSDYHGHAPDLQYTRYEASAIAGHFSSEAVLNDKATKSIVLEQASNAEYLHFACHGQSSWYSQTSATQLILTNNETIALAEVIEKLDLRKTRLVTLSACETGITDLQDTPDEFIGFPTGFMQAGAKAVISSLWTVDDRSTALLMDRMYDLMLDDNNPTSPAQALREAQNWLRYATTQEIGNYYLSHMESREASDAYIEIGKWANPNERPFNHPYYWAAFTYNGI